MNTFALMTDSVIRAKKENRNLKPYVMKNTFQNLLGKGIVACACVAMSANIFAQNANPESYFSGVRAASGYKPQSDHNPLMTQRYGADPYAMVYDDEVFIYMTSDNFKYSGNSIVTNSYEQIHTINCISSKDMVNWTDHGVMAVAGSSGAARWANCSWAPTAMHAKVNGKEKFFLYFANNGSGIGVVTSDTPYGPWTDPIGAELVSSRTPTCNTVTWLFDPAVLMDDDGTAYLYFGGGVPQGKASDPGTARVVKLGKNYTSLDGSPKAINPPYLFEDAGANKVGDTYVYSYCSNWDCTGNPMSNAQICYMTSKDPMGPFTYKGMFLPNHSEFFRGSGGNNHHAAFKFKDKWYVTYHALLLQMKDSRLGGQDLGYRSTNIDYLSVDESTATFNRAKGTLSGVDQVQYVNPFDKVEAETMAWMAGIDTKNGGSNMLVTTGVAGNWTGVAGVDFGEGASIISAYVSSKKEGAIKICKGKVDGDVIGYISVPNTNGQLQEVTATLTKAISGVSDIFFIYSGDFEFDYWMCKKADVSIIASENSVEAPATISLSVKTSEEGITKTDYYLGEELVGSATEAPYTFEYEIPEPGKYEFHAILTNNAGKTFESPTVTINARLAQGPYEGIAQELPGKVEAERYDVGGAGYAYEDNEAENQGAGSSDFRADEGVDIDSNGEGGYVLGWTAKGEWIEYTVNVKYTDTYTWAAKVASGASGSAFNMSMDGKDIAGGTIEVPQGEDWKTYSLVEGTTTQLEEGKHILKIEIEGDYANIDYIEFKAVNEHDETGLIVAKSNKVVNGEYEVYSMLGNLVGVYNISGTTIEDGLKAYQIANGLYVVRQRDGMQSELIMLK